MTLEGIVYDGRFIIVEFKMTTEDYHGKVEVDEETFNKLDPQYFISHSDPSAGVVYMCANEPETYHLEQLGIEVTFCDWYKIVQPTKRKTTLNKINYLIERELKQISLIEQPRYAINYKCEQRLEVLNILKESPQYELKDIMQATKGHINPKFVVEILDEIRK